MMADAREESSEDSSDSTSGDNFSIYTETSSSEEDLQNVEEPGTSTSSATTHNSRKRKSKSSSKQPTVKRSKRQQSFFGGKSLSKNKLTCKNAVARIMAFARSALWAPVMTDYQGYSSGDGKRADVSDKKQTSSQNVMITDTHPSIPLTRRR